jgi:UPF0716 family protein affecting phage T7 exclusion
MVYAAKIGAGGLGFLVVLLLMFAVAIIGFAMVKSLRRLRQSVAQGTFGHPDGVDLTDSTQAGTTKQPDEPASRRGPGGASV